MCQMERLSTIAVSFVMCAVVTSDAAAQPLQGRWRVWNATDGVEPDFTVNEAVADIDPDGNGPSGRRLFIGGDALAQFGLTTFGVVWYDPTADCGAGAWSVPEPVLAPLNGSRFRDALAWDPDGAGPRPEWLILCPSTDLLWFGSTIIGNRIPRWNPELSNGAGGFEPMGGELGRGDTGLWAQVATLWDRDGDGPNRAVPVIGGTFRSSPQSFGTVAVWNPAGDAGAGSWEPVERIGVPNRSFLTDVGALTSWDPDGPGPKLPVLVAGGHDTLRQNGQSTPSYVAMWAPDPATGEPDWLPMGTQLDRPVRDLTVWDPDGPGPMHDQVIAVGDFSYVNPSSLRGVARWDAEMGVWAALGSVSFFGSGPFTIEVWDPDGSGPQRETLFIGGGRLFADGTIALGAVAFWDCDASGLNGTWRALGETSLTSYVTKLKAWDPTGTGAAPSQLVAAGNFRNFAGLPAQGVAAWGMPDFIAAPKRADLNRDGRVNVEDLTRLLGGFGKTLFPGSGADVNSDGVVNVRDLIILLSEFATGGCE
ncbi:MAG: hypothetical protein ACKVZJ_04690 [Phycisphaerales bacterium]